MSELIIFTFVVSLALIVISYYLGLFIYDGLLCNCTKTPHSFFIKIESLFFKIFGIKYSEMSGKEYCISFLLLNLYIGVIGFLLILFQEYLYPYSKVDIKPDISLIFHTVCSYMTNTDQSHFIPELQFTLFTKSIVLVFIMFLSSASGLACAFMFIRAIIFGKNGNFYYDLIQSMTRILIPVAFISSILHTFFGSPNTFTDFINYETIEGVKQKLILGPVAAFHAIAVLGQNGGGYFNTNAAHPFANPSYETNFIQLFSMLFTSTALLFTLGFALKNKKQGFILVAILFIVFIFESLLFGILELKGNPYINNSLASSFSNWIGKDTRFGIPACASYIAAATNASGATNSALESFHPLSIAFMMFNMANGSFFGNQGLGPIYTFLFVILTAYFIALMIGKKPEVFGRRIEKFEMILLSILLFINPFVVLVGTTLSFVIYQEHHMFLYSDIHEFSRVLFEFLAAAANNGSGLEGLSDNTPFFNYSLGITCLAGWYGSLIFSIFLAESLGRKSSAVNQDSLVYKTDSILFIILYFFISISFTLIIFYPFIILGPIVEIILNG